MTAKKQIMIRTSDHWINTNIDKVGFLAKLCPMPNYGMTRNSLSIQEWRAFWVSVAWEKVPYIPGLEAVDGMGCHYPSRKDGEGGAWHLPDEARDVNDLSAIIYVPWADKPVNVMARIPRPYLTLEQHRRLASAWVQEKVKMLYKGFEERDVKDGMKWLACSPIQRADMQAHRPGAPGNVRRKIVVRLKTKNLCVPH